MLLSVYCVATVRMVLDDVCDHDQLNCVPIFTFANKRDLEVRLVTYEFASLVTGINARTILSLVHTITSLPSYPFSINLLQGALAAGDLAVSFYRPQTSGFSSESESSDEHTNIFSISAYTG